MNRSEKQRVAAESAELDLIARIRRGDEAAWKECIATYEGRLQAFVRSRIGDRSAAEDVVQETFLGFLNALPNYNEETPLDAFLFAIAAHKLTDLLRKRGRRPQLQSLSGSADESQPGIVPPGSARRASSMARSREQNQSEELLLASVLRELIGRWRDAGEYERLMCIELLLVRGMANKEAAVALGITEQAVANHKYFLVAKLKAAADRAHLHDWDPVRLGLN